MASRVELSVDDLMVLAEARMEFLWVSREYRVTNWNERAADIVKMEWLASKLDDIFCLADMGDRLDALSQARRRRRMEVYDDEEDEEGEES